MRRSVSSIEQILKIFFLCALLALSATKCPAQEIEITFIDVGEGDAALIRDTEDHTVLIDTGNLITGFRLAQYLSALGITSLDAVILTHPHPDHIGGIFLIGQQFPITNIYDNGADIDDLAKKRKIYRWYDQLVRSRTNYQPLFQGDSLAIGDITMEILWPPPALANDNFNFSSMVIMLKYGDFRCLFAGDLTSEGEGRLLASGLPVAANVLKVGHHGSRDATSEAFLDAVSCDSAVISIDRDNIHGYPAREVIRRLESREITVYRTDRDGDIVMKAGPDGTVSVRFPARK